MRGRTRLGVGEADGKHEMSGPPGGDPAGKPSRSSPQFMRDGVSFGNVNVFCSPNTKLWARVLDGK